MRIVFDHPRTHVTSQFIRHLAWLVGVLLLAAGLLAAVAAVPLSLAVVAHVIAYVEGTPSQDFPPDFPLRELETAFVVALLVTFVGLRYGLRVLRGTRRTVLFLRRFGFDGANRS